MAFPTTAVLDTFNRSNTGPPPSASWTGPLQSGGQSLKVVSNACVPNLAGGQSGSAYWNTAFGADQECYFKLTANDIQTIVYCRVVNPGAGGLGGYAVDFQPSSCNIYVVNGGSLSQLGSGFSQVTSNGDLVGMSVVGSTITAYTKHSGSWVAIGSETDTTYTAGGYIAVRLPPSGVIDDFGGGTVAGANFNPRRLVVGQAVMRAGRW